MEDKVNLSASLEDYLEAIFNLSSQGKVARSKDIAEVLEVSRSSVTGALKTLAEKGLVNYKPYEFITLTDIGRDEAQRVARKHNIIKSFFVNVLGVDQNIASKAACRAEHALGPRIVARLLNFMDFVSQNGKNGYDLAREFGRYCDKQNGTEKKMEPIAEIALTNIKAGQKVQLIRVDASEDLKSRLASLGMVPNTQITIINKDRLGPFVVSFKGSRIALGREMTEKIIVRPI